MIHTTEYIAHPDEFGRGQDLSKLTKLNEEARVTKWGVTRNEIYFALYPGGKADVAKFIEAVKNVSDFKPVLPAAKKLAGIFGEEMIIFNSRDSRSSQKNSK